MKGKVQNKLENYEKKVEYILLSKDSLITEILN